MTAATMPSAIFTGVPKLFLLTEDSSLTRFFSEHLDVSIIPVREGPDGALLAMTSDAEIALGAPPAGLTVVAHCSGTAAQAEKLRDLWRDAGLAEPPAVTIPQSADAPAAMPAAIAIANRFAASAVAAHKDACTEAVLLDRQIAALREQIEDSRNKWQDCAAALKAATQGLPLLGYATRDFSGRLKLTHGMVLSQQLPYAGVYCKAAAFHIAAPASGPGRLECRLLAQEDDVELAHWERIAANREGWQTLELPADIPWRYRNLRLVLIWHGNDAGAPDLSLARAAGMDRHFLQINAAPQDGARLALRAWAGHPDTPPPGGGTPPSALPVRATRTLGQPIDPGLLSHHVKLVERSLGEWPWVTLRKGTVMLHPTLAGASVIGVTINSAAGLSGIRLTCESPNQDAPPIEFLTAAWPAAAMLTRDMAGRDPLPLDTALASDGWQELPPGSAMPLALDFAPQQEPVQLVLATRVPGRSVDSAHGWFRDIRLLFRD